MKDRTGPFPDAGQGEDWDIGAATITSRWYWELREFLRIRQPIFVTRPRQQVLNTHPVETTPKTPHSSARR